MVGTLPRRRLNAEERRETILSAGARLFAERGYAATGVADIARSVGVSEPLLYKHFGSKRELFLAAVGRACEEVGRDLRAARESPDVLEALRDLARARHPASGDHASVGPLFDQAFAMADDPEVSAMLRDTNKRMLGEAEALLRAGQERGQVDAHVDVEAVVWLMGAVVRTRGIREAFLRGGQAAQIEQRMYDFIIRSVSAEGAADGPRGRSPTRGKTPT